MSDRHYIKKRRVPRRAFAKKIGLLAKGAYHIVASIELGEGGMLIKAPVGLVEGQLVVLSFQIPGMIHVVSRGVVKYIKPIKGSNIETYGIQFETIDFDARRKIRSFVAQKSMEELKVS